MAVVMFSVALLTGATWPVPEVLVAPRGEAVTSEDGKQVQVEISLARRPSGTVTVVAESSDVSEARVSAAVRFNRFNWRQPQVIVVTGVDDDSLDGDVPYEVRFMVESGFNPQPVEVELLPFTNSDDEQVSVAGFDGIGTLLGGVTASWVQDVSAAGDVVVGFSAGRRGDEAFRWTPASGIQSLGAGGGTSRAYGVSPDGTLVVGSASPLNASAGGAIWRAGGSLAMIPGVELTPGQPPYFTIATAHAVTDAGQVYGECWQTGSLDGPIGCVWSEADKLRPLPASIIFAADAVGNFCGTTEPTSVPNPSFGSVAILNDRELPYARNCLVPHDCGAEARGFTTGAAVVVGTSLVPAENVPPPAPAAPLVETAFVYTSSAGSLPLPSLFDDQQGSGAYDVSSDGRVIAGYVTTADGSQAVLWVDREPLLVAELPGLEGSTNSQGWSLRELRAVSADGLTLVGNGLNPAGRSEAFRVVLTALP